MQKILLILSFIIIILLTSVYFYITQNKTGIKKEYSENNINISEDYQSETTKINPLTIESLRQGNYLGSDILIEQTLDSGVNYKRYIASYKSEGLKIFGLLTVPNGDIPEGGWPVIIFNHGYIPPKEYRTTERYVGYVDGFARNRYIVFKPDYRGHGSSEGEPTGAYGSNGYMNDVLNALASLKREGTDVALRQAQGQSSRVVNPDKIGMWGHSLGGFLTLRSMVVSKDIKAGVIWAGVVGSYPDLLNNWRRGTFTPPPGIPSGARRWRDLLVEQYGTPEQNPTFWNSISANSYLLDISGPLQLHHGTVDASVPVAFSSNLEVQMKEAKKDVELYIYPQDDHNLSQNFSLAMQRSIDFFNEHLKN